MLVMTIDPGTIQSAFVKWDMESEKLVNYGIVENEKLLGFLHGETNNNYPLAIEMIACYGMKVGADVFHTCVWIGRFMEAWGEAELIYRKDIKRYLCRSMRAKDGDIRQALIDRFGEPGTKEKPGRLYGVKSHIWSALAVAVFYMDKLQEGRRWLTH